METTGMVEKTKPRAVVVGPCASGKTTLVRHLLACGFDAYVCGQEHSDIPTLFAHGHPDVVIALEVELATIRARRGEDWPENIYRLQLARLATARSRAGLVLDSSTMTQEEMQQQAVAWLRGLVVRG